MAVGAPPYATEPGMRPVGDPGHGAMFQTVCAGLRAPTQRGFSFPAVPWVASSELSWLWPCRAAVCAGWLVGSAGVVAVGIGDKAFVAP
eukprot:3563034-Alexandrium_andersonii.AAC.1